MQSGAVESCCVCSIAACRVCSSAGVLQRGASINTSQGAAAATIMRPPLAPCTLLLTLALAGAQLENSCETLSSQIHLVKVNTVKCAFIIAKICAACCITIWSIRLIFILLSCHPLSCKQCNFVIIYLCHYIYAT